MSRYFYRAVGAILVVLALAVIFCAPILAEMLTDYESFPYVTIMLIGMLMTLFSSIAYWSE